MNAETDSATQQSFPDTYTPALLRPLPREQRWRTLGHDTSPFDYAVDTWFAWELSWLNPEQQPQIAIAELHIPGNSRYLIESKSLKYYLFSLNQHSFTTITEVQNTIREDISSRIEAAIEVLLRPLAATTLQSSEKTAHCLDDLPLKAPVTQYYDPSLLAKKTAGTVVEEYLCSHLLRSKCPLTGQPDWGSVYIGYQGQALEHEALLRYLISWRNHSGFAEHCTESIFLDIMQQCTPNKLSVCCRYLRRGGIDINVYRSNCNTRSWQANTRDIRQ